MPTTTTISRRWLLAGLALAAACGDEGGGSTPTEADAGTGTIPTLRSDDCHPADLLDARLGSTQAVDCGTLGFDAVPPALAEARACLAQALQAGEPVRLLQWNPGIDSGVATAYLVDASGVASVLHYGTPRLGSDQEGAWVSEERCTRLSLLAAAECTPSNRELCVRCEPPTTELEACSTLDGN